MKRILIWTPIAREDYASILAFLELHYGTNNAIAFLDKTESIFQQILKFPSMYAVSIKKKKIRKVVVTKQTSFLYTVNGNEIWILEFINNRSE